MIEDKNNHSSFILKGEGLSSLRKSENVRFVRGVRT